MGQFRLCARPAKREIPSTSHRAGSSLGLKNGQARDDAWVAENHDAENHDLQAAQGKLESRPDEGVAGCDGGYAIESQRT